MKKSVIAILLVCFSASLFAMTGNIKLRSMSLTGIADSSSDANYFVNPASLYFYNQATKFNLTSGFISNPDFYISTEFINKRISFSADVDFHSTDTTVYRDVVLDFSAAAGYKNASFGLGFYGGSSMYQKKGKNSTAYALFGRYKRVEESEFLNLKAGAVYKLNDFTFGIVADKVFTYSEANEHFSWEDALDGISAGMYWTRQKYAKRGRLNKWVFSAGAEAVNIFSRGRAVSVGMDATLQLNKVYSLSFRTGSSLSMISGGPKSVSMGVGTRIDLVDVGACLVLPVFNSNIPASFEINFSIIN